MLCALLQWPPVRLIPPLPLDVVYFFDSVCSAAAEQVLCHIGKLLSDYGSDRLAGPSLPEPLQEEHCCPLTLLKDQFNSSPCWSGRLIATLPVQPIRKALSPLMLCALLQWPPVRLIPPLPLDVVYFFDSVCSAAAEQGQLCEAGGEHWLAAARERMAPYSLSLTRLLVHQAHAGQRKLYRRTASILRLFLTPFLAYYGVEWDKEQTGMLPEAVLPWPASRTPQPAIWA